MPRSIRESLESATQRIGITGVGWPRPRGGDRVRRYRAADRVAMRVSTDMNDRTPTREGFGHGRAMSRLALTFACCRYDRMDALRARDVVHAGLTLHCITLKSGREI